MAPVEKKRKKEKHYQQYVLHFLPFFLSLYIYNIYIWQSHPSTQKTTLPKFVMYSSLTYKERKMFLETLDVSGMLNAQVNKEKKHPFGYLINFM